MGTINLLTNEAIWQSLSEQVKSAHRVDAAIAYFGRGGAKLVPLRHGHRLVVDMSPATVKVGSTDPFEIEKLIRRGVVVFTRGNLHAKIVIADDTVLVGSANASWNSHDNLDEAAILTRDPAAVRRAREFFERLCTEPVRPEYLKECKNLYRPPRFTGKRASKTGRTRRATHAKLWLVSLIDYHSFPDSESERYEESEKRARKLLANAASSNLTSFHWPHRPKMADELEKGDWIIQCITHEDKSASVHPPAQLLWIDHYIRDKKTGKERYVFHLEIPKRGQTMKWQVFRRAIKSTLGIAFDKPRTRPIRDTKQADHVLRIWTPGGRVARR
jgi:hypothetical protein